MSPVGLYIAYFVSRGGPSGDETLFRGVEVDSRREWQHVFDEANVDTRYILPATRGFALFLNGASVVQLP